MSISLTFPSERRYVRKYSTLAPFILEEAYSLLKEVMPIVQGTISEPETKLH